MNIADTSNHGNEIEPLNSADAPQPEEGDSSIYPVVDDEDVAVSNLPLLKPAADREYETTGLEDGEGSTPEDWVAEPDSEEQAYVDSEFQKLLALNEELRAANNSLYTTVDELKKELAESDRLLQWQKTRSSVTESMLNQQTQELSAAQEQIKSLFQQLETMVQTVQRQELCVETYKAQLQISHQRLAQLERECSLLQTNYNEQSQKLIQSENSCRELRSRLMRQQRQTLQFKAALEKCLDTPVPHYDTLDDNNHNYSQNSQSSFIGQSRFSRKARSLFPNAQPIKPWSADSDSVHESLSHSWVEPIISSSYQSSYSPSSYSSPENLTDNSLDEKEDHTLNLPNLPNLSTPPTSTTPLPPVDEPVTTSETTSEIIETADSPQLDQQLESLIQMFFTSQPGSTTPVTTGDEVKSNQVNVPNLDFLPSSQEADHKDQPGEIEVNFSPTVYTTLPADFLLSFHQDNPVNTSSTTSKIDQPGELEDYWSDVSIPPQPKLPLNDLSAESIVKNPHLQSPSPLVYPERPPKGRKSLASVELPNFRPKGK
ncbi:MAG TPA: hypothetical protein VK184_10505 [Nostocaceae cyanobacterium]|nr:hypothetical protein [Nostocaceae cyanobacterium]